jgi:hypothetical protein
MAGDDFHSYHYVVFNPLVSLPTTGTMTCNAGKSTKPNNLGGGTSISQANSYSTASGTAGITFDSSGGNVNLVITVSGEGVTGTANVSGLVRSVGSSYISGGLGGLGNGAMVILGVAGNGARNVLAI